jgi:pimeloyl-ACP methyl ester carboxylesterase
MQFHSFAREGRAIAAYSVGTGKTIIGLSGFGCFHHIYEDICGELSKNFSIVLIENRGIGKSDLTTTDYEIADLARDAKFVIDQMGIKEFGVMGISMGGFIAQELVKLNPESTRALALMCTTSGNSDFIHPAALTEEGLRQFAALDPQIAAEFSTMGTTHPSLKQNNPNQYKRIVDERVTHRANLEEQIRQNRAAVKFIKSPFDLSVIKCPTLAMCGENDRFVSPENINVFKKNIKNCVTATIPETDHYFFMEKPLEVANKLNQFFIEVL